MRFSYPLLAGILLFTTSFGVCDENTGTGEKPASSFDIDAWAFDRGNFTVYLTEYSNGGSPVIANGGAFPDKTSFVEYDIPFPAPGKYTLTVLVAQAEKRPLDVFFDGKELGKICDEKLSGSWLSTNAIWEKPFEISIESAGIHTIKLQCKATPPPHLVKLRFTSDTALPADWKPERPKANKLPIYEKQFQGDANFTAAEPKPEAIRRAILDLITTYGEKYPHGKDFLERLDSLTSSDNKNSGTVSEGDSLEKLRYEAVYLANPLLDFDSLVLVRRNVKGAALGFPANFDSNSSLPRNGYDDEIMLMSAKTPENDLVSLYKPPRDTLISDLDLDFDASRLMFTSIGENNRWHIFEWNRDTKDAKQLTKGGNDIDFFDSCYLPDGRIMLTNTAPMTGVPCLGGGAHVANLFLFDPPSGEMRQIGFDQDHNWCPAVLNDGRVMYTRWEYADIPHSNSRLLFHCNPDGTSQTEYYGSNSYWPTSVFCARPVPNHPTKVIGVIGGHHDNGRIGELVIFDPAISRREADGVVQKIPGYGKKVEAVVVDGLTRNAWPKFVHPIALSEKYFLVSARPSPQSKFGIYMVDVFDNMILLKELEGNALVEPIPFKSVKRPPAIPDRVDLAREDGNIFISNILDGPGLKDIPPGVVKKLRVHTYHFSYQGIGGLLGSVGQDGPWDVRGVLGTVPVEEDGSVHFRVPANLPVALLPLDENGQAIQLMRSWMTVMPGENLHCNGCHESQNSTPPAHTKSPIAMSKPPAEITAFNAPEKDGKNLLKQLNVRGFSFREQVQPVLDKYCVSCHNGEGETNAKTAIVKDRPVGPALDGKPFAIDLRGDRNIEGWSSDLSGNCGAGWGGKWSVGYDNLQRFVRRPGIESDYGLLVPMEFAANTTELVQMLKYGHHGVKLDADSWSRLMVWIDMNAPFHDNWSDIYGGGGMHTIGKRRLELAGLYGAEGIAFEEKNVAIPVKTEPGDSANPAKANPGDFPAQNNIAADFKPFSAEGAKKLQEQLPGGKVKTLVLKNAKGDDVTIKLRHVPAYGKLEKSFWIGECEISNAQFRLYDSKHSSGREDRIGYQFGRRGYDMDGDDLPVVRVNWNNANAFCEWLSEKTSQKIVLPNEEQWEYAARAGAETPFWFGGLDSDFSAYANMGDTNLKEQVACTAHNYYTSVRIIPNPNPFDDRIPKDERFSDGGFMQIKPGSYEANPFGLCDMHGNVAEWTRSELAIPGHRAEKIVKGGSWYDRPYRCASGFRISYPEYQPVFNVGFRIVIEE